jgi:hypothetical protein
MWGLETAAGTLQTMGAREAPEGRAKVEYHLSNLAEGCGALCGMVDGAWS